MRQFLQLASRVKSNGVYKNPSRKDMPKTISVFGEKMSFNLQDGFPLITTKKMPFKTIVRELQWFLRGDTNIKYLVDHGVKIWNQDAYNYYLKIYDYLKQYYGEEIETIGKATGKSIKPFTFSEFITQIKQTPDEELPIIDNYKLGDCGHQYGKVWRNWNYIEADSQNDGIYQEKKIDQIENLFQSLRDNPESRRHVLTAIDPAHDDKLALYWCHALFQLNVRPISDSEREKILENLHAKHDYPFKNAEEREVFKKNHIPYYYLDGQLYQRSGDLFLGVPFNIASYSLLIHIFASKLNMIPGNFIHNFGDLHLYENHLDVISKQQSNPPRPLPSLNISDLQDYSIDYIAENLQDLVKIINYNPHEKIEAPLNTGS